MLPAIINHQIAGSPWTDLYASVWSLWATEDWWLTWRTNWLNYPNGQHWTPNSIIWGTIIIPFKSILNMGLVYNCCLCISRWLGCWAWYLVGKSIGGTHKQGLMWMICISMHPMIHGFAVEGIFEGTQIWALGFSIYCMKERKYTAQVGFGTLVILTNWYWSLLWGIVGFIMGLKDKRIWLTLGVALTICLPWVHHFIQFSSEAVAINSTILREMGIQFAIPTPNLLTPKNPFSQSNYFGWILTALIVSNIRSIVLKPQLLFVIGGLLLSLGIDWSIPVLSSIRFPYRIHLLTMIGSVWLLKSNTQIAGKFGKWILCGVFLEQLILSPIDLIIPTSSQKIPDYVSKIDGPVLEIPGPLYRDPGQTNPSRSRMKQVLFYQTVHNQPSGWSLDFNGLTPPSDCFGETRHLDTQANPSEIHPANDECWNSIEWIVVHNSNTYLDAQFTTLGFIKLSDSPPILWRKKESYVD